MQQGIIYKSVIGCWMLSFFASMPTAVAVEYSNPWVLPQAPMTEDWQQSDGQIETKQQPPQAPASQPKVWRFVTPEILDSLKQQQTQMQLMPGQIVPGQRRRVEPSGSCPVPPNEQPALQPQFVVPGSGLMPQSSYYRGQSMMPAYAPSVAPSGMPYGMNNPNPVYDSPAVSPWGQGADVLYRGESVPNSFPGSVPSDLDGRFPGMTQGAYPWVPNEAMGGLLPIPVPSSIEDSYQREIPRVTDITNPGNIEKGKVENVFNPFTFLPGETPR